MVKDIDVSSGALRLSWVKDLGNSGQEKAASPQTAEEGGSISALNQQRQYYHHAHRRIQMDVDVDRRFER